VSNECIVLWCLSAEGAFHATIPADFHSNKGATRPESGSSEEDFDGDTDE